jgi:hypothetical protein
MNQVRIYNDCRCLNKAKSRKSCDITIHPGGSMAVLRHGYHWKMTLLKTCTISNVLVKIRGHQNLRYH